MKALSLFLIGAGILGLTGPARALPVDTVFSVVVVDGPDPSDGNDVGALSFKLASDLGARGCRYSGAWSGVQEGALGARCSLDEAKTHGHASCAANSQAAFGTLLRKDPRAACSVIDSFGQQRDLFMLVAAESADPAGINGLLQWTAAAPFVSSFEATPYP